MDINFDDKKIKPASQSDIDQLRINLKAEKFQEIYILENNNNSITLENNNKLNSEEEEKNNDENNNNKGIKEETENKNDINNENNNQNEIQEKNSLSPKKEELNNEIKEQEQDPELEIKEEKVNKKIFDLVPLWYKCLNKEHDSKYISLDRKKKNLICKYCLQNGALETNLDLNEEFVDKYIKDLEEKNKINNSELSKDIIKETSEENKSEREETNHKINLEENSENISNIKEQISCLTFLCPNFPYYFCENCKEFICYKCLSENMDANNVIKNLHYFHDIESVNYEANSFRDDVNINLDTLENIISSLDFLISEEKKRIKYFRNKIDEEARPDLNNYYIKILEKIKEKFIENNKELFNKYSKKIYGNNSNDINDLNISNTNTKNNINNIMEELKIIKDKINSEDISNEDKCGLHNKYIELLKSSKNLISKGKSILSQSDKLLFDLNKEETINKYNEYDSIQNKVLLDKEKYFIQSLSNATKNKGSYKLNRFVTYRHEGIKYFGFSTLEFSCNNDIILYGIFLCGKYLSSNKIKQKDYSEISLYERSFYNINVKIYELNSKSILINENKKLFEIIDANNPIININFEKGIQIKKEEKYVIVVENLEDDKFCDIWVGNVHKILISNKVQNIKCNNTGFEFNFYLSNEFNSDLNEFKQGIIEGILYGN